MDKLKQHLDNRRRFAFSQLDYAFEAWWCNWRKKHIKQSDLSSRNRVYKHGIQRFRVETDIVGLIKSLRMLKTLSRIMLSNYQMCLLSLENSNLLYDKYQNKSEQYNDILQGNSNVNRETRHKITDKLKSYK